MKFTLPLAAALSVFSISSAAPVPGPGLAALGGLLGPVTNALGGLGNAAGGPQAQAAPVPAPVDADAKLLVTSRIHAHAESALLKHCPLGDDKCIIELAADIAASIESAVKIDVDHLFTALRANLLTYVRAKVEVVVRDLGLNLFVEQIHVAGFVDATAEINLFLESCYHVIVHALNITIVANVVAVIKALLSV
ncbi:hypothetical protein CPB97_011243 [Podila verticillata]|nr:hypothetical protein CPB97_011243 [Podila verticillata]